MRNAALAHHLVADRLSPVIAVVRSEDPRAARVAEPELLGDGENDAEAIESLKNVAKPW